MIATTRHRPACALAVLTGLVRIGVECALAQPLPTEGFAQWAWEGSIDGGLTWQRDTIIVTELESDVLVRAFVTFDQPRPTMYFGAMTFDPYLQSPPGGNSLDWISNVGGGDIGRGAFGSPFRLNNNIVKIDDPNDTDPPGLGPFWAGTLQLSPNFPVSVSFRNNVPVYNFTVELDGRLGDRRIDAAFPVLPDRPAPPYITVWDRRLGGPFGYYQIINDYRPLTISVIPGPGTWILGVVALGFACRRRRVSLLNGRDSRVCP